MKSGIDQIAEERRRLLALVKKWKKEASLLMPADCGAPIITAHCFALNDCASELASEIDRLNRKETP